MLNKEDLLILLEKEVTPALGCTEPVCVALSAADAYHAIEGQIVSVKVEVNANIFKNGMSVGIPGCPKVGLNYAAALGACLGNPHKGLRLLEDITESVNVFADDLVKSGKVLVTISPTETGLYSHTKIITTNGIGISTIRDSHANIVFTKRNNTVIISKKNAAESADNEMYDKLKDMKLSDIRVLVEAMTPDQLRPMLKGMEMNGEIADFGLNHNTGIGIGESLKSMSESNLWGSSLQSRIMMRTAACAESRMSGCPHAVMSSSGSGNHGITAIIPVAEMAKELGSSDENLAKALALSHIVTLYIKQYTGRLSPICGCGMCAASGAAAAMVWLMGGTDIQIEGAVINMTADITGMICDGGKIGCALKLATAASAALMCACLAVRDVIVPSTDGVTAGTAEEAVRNMGAISIPGMLETDKAILDIMLRK